MARSVAVFRDANAHAPNARSPRGFPGYRQLEWRVAYCSGLAMARCNASDRSS